MKCVSNMAMPHQTNHNNLCYFLFFAGKIAWDYLDRTLEKMIAWSNRPPLFSRKSENFEFNEENFKDAVVVPTYRNQGTDVSISQPFAEIFVVI